MATKEKRLLRRDAACERLGGISMVFLYKLASEGEIKLVKIGSRSFITEDSVVDYIERLEADA